MKIILKTKLYRHQVNSIKFHLTKPRSGNWSEMGVGKTIVSLEVLRLLYNARLIDYVLIICPLSVVETWATEIVKHTTFSFTRLIGPLEHKIKLLQNETPIFLISYDSIPGRKRTLGILLHALIRKKFGYIICDEATHIKSYNALRTKAVTHLCDIVKKTLFLSGTPIVNRPEDVLTIYRVMDGGSTFGRNFFAARNRYFENRGYFYPDWYLRKDKEEEFKNRLFTNCIRILKKECLNLPEKIFTERYAYLTPEQISIYVPIANELLKELYLPAGKVKVANRLVKLAKLSQITNGFVYTDNKPQVFIQNPKLELLYNAMKEIPESDKIVIFAKWRQDIENIKQSLSNNNIPHVVLHGSIKDRQTPIEEFTNDPSKKILLSQITVGAYGLNLAVANYVIYYSFGFSASEFWQSQDRIHRIGQTKTCIYIPLLCANSIDTYILDVLKAKTDLSRSLVDEISINRLKQNLEKIVCLN